MEFPAVLRAFLTFGGPSDQTKEDGLHPPVLGLLTLRPVYFSGPSLVTLGAIPGRTQKPSLTKLVIPIYRANLHTHEEPRFSRW